jgi:hypothetical protein
MITMTLTDDPYPNPFDWANTLAPEAPEHRLYGLLPCGFQCESGWVVQIDGTVIACPECGRD